jgi:uncharacterized membrane protein YraQ (UPF0718 family)
MYLLTEINEIFNLVLYQFRIMFIYWISGILAGVLISVFLGAKIGSAASNMSDRGKGLPLILFASLIGAASPICMYGTIPIMATLSKKGMPHYVLVSFMVSSVLINPNLFVASFALGMPLALARMIVSILAGISAGLLIRCFFREGSFFDFSSFEIKKKCREEMTVLKRFFKELNATIVKVTPYFLAGILLTALVDKYFPKEILRAAFSSNRGLGVLLSASLGVPVYFCGGGSIPLLNACINAGMSYGSAIAFMVTGPATKLNNLSALKAVLGVRNFILYIAFIMLFAILTGLICDFII